jgi:DNA-binding CsgD family transcriptional regulator
MTESDDDLNDRLEAYGNPNWVSSALDKISKLKEESLLTDRQAEVYALRKAGLRNENVAEILDIKKQTASTYFGKAKERFDTAERTVELREEIEPDPLPHQG